MTLANRHSTFTKSFLFIGIVLLALNIAGCGKSNSTSATGLNIEYEVLNLSPDIGPFNLYINNARANSTPYIFAAIPSYFSVSSIAVPYQIRTALTPGTTVLSRSDVLHSNVKYSLFVVGDIANKSEQTIFTIDTASAPASGRGKVRFIDASPTGTAGLDLFANGTAVFTKVVYPKVTTFRELPVGNYDFQINTNGSSSVLKTLSSVTIQDGRIYTIYAYGYTSRIDTALFNAGVITNK
jgi:hypothetical protein